MSGIEQKKASTYQQCTDSREKKNVDYDTRYSKSIWDSAMPYRQA